MGHAESVALQREQSIAELVVELDAPRRAQERPARDLESGDVEIRPKIGEPFDGSVVSDAEKIRGSDLVHRNAMPMVLVADPPLDRTFDLELHECLAYDEHTVQTVDAAETVAACRLELSIKAAVPSSDCPNFARAGEPDANSRPKYRGHAAGM